MARISLCLAFLRHFPINITRIAKEFAVSIFVCISINYPSKNTKFWTSAVATELYFDALVLF